MNQYIATVRVQGQSYRTGITADSPVSARVLLQFMFGKTNVISPPVLSEGRSKGVSDAVKIYFDEATIKPIAATKPKTPEQSEIANLQARVKQAQQAVKAARARQQMVRAQRSMQAII
jgi:hypothetical protein